LQWTYFKNLGGIIGHYLQFVAALTPVDYFRPRLCFARMDISKIWLLLVLAFFI
jgi:hypothetical protein